MAKKTSKRKKVKRKSSWLKFTIAMIILVCGLLYILKEYGDLDISKDLLKGYIPKTEIEVALYFTDPHSDYLVDEQRIIKNVFSQQQKIRRTVEELIKGPKGKLIRTIPSATRLKDVRIDSDGVVWLDFSSNLSQDHPGGSSSEIMTVYTIVITVLLNFNEVAKVRILIDGAEVKTLAGHIDCSKPFLVDKDFVK